MLSAQSGPADARPSRPWPADRVERWPIERLIPYATNPRVHTAADIDKIAASIVEFGWTMPPLVDQKGIPIPGPARVPPPAKLPHTSIPPTHPPAYTTD